MVDIRAELEKKIQESNQRATSLSDRLNQLDEFNQGTAVPQISSQGPKGYNPMNSLQALFSMISNRKAVAGDVSAERDAGLGLLNMLGNYEERDIQRQRETEEDLSKKREQQGMSDLLRTIVIGKQGWKPSEAKPTSTPKREDVAWKSPLGQWEWSSADKEWRPTGMQGGQRYNEDLNDVLTNYPEASGKAFSSLEDILPQKDETEDVYEKYRKAGFSDKEIKELITVGIISL